MIAMYALLYLGTALFWAAYALDGIFTEMVAWISDSQAVRLAVLIVALGAFSALYTYLGGLRAVVRTDLAQFILLLGGGLITVSVAVHHLGGWSALLDKTGHLMHLHLPRDHQTIPWTALIGMNLLNLNYWGANQVNLQRALAAKSLRDAQLGLLVGGVLKYVMLLIIVIPGIAMAGILADAPLDDPDAVYITLVNEFLPAGLRGLIVCGLFASLMSTVDSIFNSVSTLWSIDIYKRYLRRDASPQDIVRIGKMAILGTFAAGVLFAFTVVFFKTGSLQADPLTHWFNELSYYVKNGFVVIVTAAVFLIRPSRHLVLGALIGSMALYLGFTLVWPETSYLVRSGWVIVLSFAAVGLVSDVLVSAAARVGGALTIELSPVADMEARRGPPLPAPGRRHRRRAVPGHGQRALVVNARHRPVSDRPRSECGHAWPGPTAQRVRLLRCESPHRRRRDAPGPRREL